MTKARSLANSVNPGSVPGSRLEDGAVTDSKASILDPISAQKVEFISNGAEADERSVSNKLREYVSVFDFIPESEHEAIKNWTSSFDCTSSIQNALDSPGYTPIFFPPGRYRVSGSGEACLTLSKNRILFGSARPSQILAISGPNTSVLKIAFDDNRGSLDVRNWSMRDLQIVHGSGGLHGILIKDGFPILTSSIINCHFFSGPGSTNGYGIYISDQWAHSRIELCTFDYAFMGCLDANVISKCLTFGTRCAITFDCILGVRNNSVLDNTIVNRDGAVRIINGDNIRIENNQIELAQGYVPNTSQSPVSAMVWIEGVDRPVPNTVIRANNFGGGTNLNRLIYIDNGYRTVIRENYLIAPAASGQDLYLTSQAKFVSLGPCNTVEGKPGRPRPRPLLKAVVTDLGIGNMGIYEEASKLSPQNGWTCSPFYKDEYGVVRFLEFFSGGATASTTIIGTLPEGFRPSQLTRLVVTTQGGTGQVSIDTSGVIRVDSLPSSSQVMIPSFQSSAVEDPNL